MNILIIGGGNMGLTFAKSFIHSHVVTREQLTILEKDEARINFLKSENVGIITSNPESVKQADLIVLAVKPQVIKSLFAEINDFSESNQVFLSIMAGVKIDTIRQYLGAKKIIRAMPNMPSQIGLGMTAFTATDDVSRFELGAIQNLLSTTGKTLQVEKETMIDAVTAVSGSGPAYIYYFIDSMIQAANNLGFSKSESQLLVYETFRGALSLYKQNDLSCQEWISKVASRGGTTEAAINSFDGNQLSKKIQEGLNAAFERAVFLSKN